MSTLELLCGISRLRSAANDCRIDNQVRGILSDPADKRSHALSHIRIRMT